LAFLNNQRLREGNGKVFQAIATAKSEAKKSKVTKNLQFRMNGEIAEYAMYNTGDIPLWQRIGDDLVVSAIAIPFDYKGLPKVTTLPVTVTVTKGNLKRCTSLVTLLGAVRQGENSQCP
jgi:hypothetical protein